MEGNHVTKLLGEKVPHAYPDRLAFAGLADIDLLCLDSFQDLLDFGTFNPNDFHIPTGSSYP